MTIPEIVHDLQAQCFTLEIEGKKALLEYRLMPALVSNSSLAINFTHTFVPPELRGGGFAERLVRHGLKWAREQGYEVRASCWYVNKFLRQHPPSLEQ